MDNKNCIFCKISNNESPAKKIAESNNFIAIKDIQPVSKGHALIIPKKHFVTFLDLPNKLSEEFVKFTKEVSSKILDQKLGDGFNILINNLEASGQVVMHFHAHLIPRKEGDGLKTIR